MTEQNKDIRASIKESGVHMYEIAHELGISDAWFSKLLRYELPAEKKTQILQAIERIRKGE